MIYEFTYGSLHFVPRLRSLCVCARVAVREMMVCVCSLTLKRCENVSIVKICQKMISFTCLIVRSLCVVHCDPVHNDQFMQVSVCECMAPRARLIICLCMLHMYKKNLFTHSLARSLARSCAYVFVNFLFFSLRFCSCNICVLHVNKSVVECATPNLNTNSWNEWRNKDEKKKKKKQKTHAHTHESTV